MSYTTDYHDSSKRHWKDAEALRRGNSTDSAAYHYGFAAECAIKHAISALLPVNASMWKHISIDPSKDFRAIAVKKLVGRVAEPLRKLLLEQTYFKDWDVAMRYAPTGAVAKNSCDEWAKHARRTLAASGITP
jgi:hypothetical protein